MEDNVLAHYVFIQLALKVELDSGGDFEPSLARCHTCAHIGGAYACGERSESAVCTGVAVGADDAFARCNYAFFGEQCVLNAHIAHIVIMLYIILARKSPALESVSCGLYILVGCEVVHYH